MVLLDLFPTIRNNKHNMLFWQKKVSHLLEPDFYLQFEPQVTPIKPLKKCMFC